MEMASTHIKGAIDALMNMYALANMHRASGNREYAEGAMRWIESVERSLAMAKEDLARSIGAEKAATSGQ